MNPASTTTGVQASLTPSSFGQKATYTATVTAGSETFDNRGKVQFQVDGSNFGSPVALSGGTASIQETNGVATFTTSGLDYLSGS